MPTNQSVILQKGTVPPDACFNNVSELYDLFIGTTTAYVNGNYSLFNYGENKPSTDDTDKPWIRTVGNLPDRVYVYASGYWLSKHQTPAGGDERRIWVGSLADLKTYDGGADEDVNDFSGPFWEVDDAMSARFPVGVGEFDASGEVAVTETGGEDKHTLVSDALPDHTHNFTVNKSVTGDDAAGPQQILMADRNINATGGVQPDVTVDGGGGGLAHNNLPPYYGVYFIKRTGRIYYAIK
jgi:hypothetical protein